MESALSALAESGLTPAEQHDAFLVLIGLVRSSAQQLADTRGDSYEDWGPAMLELVRKHRDRYPSLLKAIEQDAFVPSGVDNLEFGMRLVLDGLELRLSRR